MNLKNKIIIVTGGKGLLGSIFVKHLADADATVIAADITAKKDLDNGEYTVDITDTNSVQALIDAVLSKYKKIDGWVNNAYPRTKDWGASIENVTTESWHKNVEMHMGGYFICAQAILKTMQQQGFGSLINMSSIYGINGPDFTIYEGTAIGNPVQYAAIKGGIVNLTKYLAAYYGKYNVRVNSVSPGGIFDNQDEIFVKQYNHRVPMKRMGLPADIAPSIAFLLSDGAAYITGHNLVVDGGWSAI